MLRPARGPSLGSVRGPLPAGTFPLGHLLPGAAFREAREPTHDDRLHAPVRPRDVGEGEGAELLIRLSARVLKSPRL